MRRQILWAILLGSVGVLSTVPARAQNAVRPADDEQVIRKDVEQYAEAYNKGDLRTRLAKWHPNVDVAFRGWNDVWLDNDFRQWDISEELAYVRVPILIVQGEDDQYGTLRQIEIADEECYCPVDVALLPGVKHQPHREGTEARLAARSEKR